VECSLAEGGCHSVVFKDSLPFYARQPLVAKYRHIFGVNFSNVTVEATFRGFDNELGGLDRKTINTSLEISCIPRVGKEPIVETVTTRFNLIASSPTSAPWEPPANVVVPCLVRGETAKATLNFGTADAAATHSQLTTWTRPDDLPWVGSRPSRAVRTVRTAGSVDTVTYDALGQPILKAIESGPEDGSLVLALKPELDSSDASWKVCIYPGDGVNYYDELCTEEFDVRGSQALCDVASKVTTTAASGASTLAASSALLALSFAMWIRV